MAPRHVDEFIDDHRMDAYARFFLHLHRLPAGWQMAFAPFMRHFKLFCDYKGERFRVTGASRLGDVWLVKDIHQDTGYDHRVEIDHCSKWGGGEKWTNR